MICLAKRFDIIHHLASSYESYLGLANLINKKNIPSTYLFIINQEGIFLISLLSYYAILKIPSLLFSNKSTYIIL